MKHVTIITTLRAILCCGMLALTTISCAEEEGSRLSLGYTSMNLAPADPKAPAPAAVTAKYGFGSAKDFKPYLGTGLAYSYQPEAKPGDTTKIRAGVAGQAGFRYLLGGNSSLSFDYKYFNVTPDPTRGDSRTAPHSLGVGFDIKF
jgi:outer membrane protein W